MGGLTTSQAAGLLGLGAIVASFLAVIVVFTIIYYVLLVIAWWKIFTKAGEKGWKSIIPFYNFYVQCKLTWSTKFFWGIIGMAVLAAILSGIVPSMDSSIKMIFNIVILVLYIAILVLAVISDYRLSKAFGHGGGFTVGLIFLNFIFMLVLGFGKSKYEGNVYLKAQKKKK